MKKIFTCKDYTVSGKEFSLVFDPKYDMLLTQPKPSLDELPDYYKSDMYISHTDSHRTFFDKIYQFVRSITLNNKIKLIEKFSLSGKKLLDVGCGTGAFLQIAEANSWQVTGVEPNKKANSFAESKLSSNAKLFFDLDMISNEKYKNSFDVITLWHVLEHVPDLRKYISQLKYLLKPDGVLVIAVPNYKSYDAKFYTQYWAAYDVPRHLWHFSKQSIKKLFFEYDMKLTSTVPMKFDAFYVSLLSEKYKTTRQRPFAAFKIAFLSNWKAKQTGEYSSLIYLLKNR